MNRRHFFTAMGTSVGLLLTHNRDVLARLQYLSTPVPETKPAFEIDDYSNQELVYLSALFTWLELLEESLVSVSAGIDAVAADPDSSAATTQMLLALGVWPLLETDTQKITAPTQFTESHGHAMDIFSHLASAASILSQGVVGENATALSLSTEHIFLATDSVTALTESLGFARPMRADLIG